MIDLIKNKYSKKVLIAFFSLILIVLFATNGFADSSVALSSSNITAWPTTSYVNGETMYFGQSINEAVVLSGGTVEYNGTIVNGHFEFIDPNSIPTSTGNKRADIKFVPDDTTAFVGFEVTRCRNVTYTVSATTPVFVDEVNDPIVATEVEAGALLSTSTLSGGKMINPYNAEEPKLLAAEWIWSPSINQASSTFVYESGYYTAQLVATGYTMVTAEVYVKIASAIPETTIVEYPTVPELTYNPDVTWADIELTGGKAVIKGTETEVEGTFAIKESRLTANPNPNFSEIEIVFTPANAEEALPNEFTIPVKVNALPISFGEDYKGTAIDEPFEVEVEYGSKVSEVLFQAKKHLNYPTPSVVMIEDANSLAENGKVYKVSVLNYNNSNYTGTYAYVKAIFKTTEIAAEIKKSTGSGRNRFFVDCGDYSPEGTFTVYCNGEEIAEVKHGIPFDCVVYTDAGGTYEITTKYNPVENDYFIVADALWSITLAPVRDITVANTSSMPFTVNGNSGHTAEIRTGDTIEMQYTMPEFAYWVIKDCKGNTVTLDGVDLTSKKISFAMPDCDLKISVKTPAQLEQEEAEANCDHLCHSDNAFYQVLWNILSIIFRLFNIQQYCDCGATHYDAPIFGFIS